MRPPVSIKHHITKYGEDGARYAEAWVQVDILNRCWCLWRKRVEI